MAWRNFDFYRLEEDLFREEETEGDFRDKAADVATDGTEEEKERGGEIQKVLMYRQMHCDPLLDPISFTAPHYPNIFSSLK